MTVHQKSEAAKYLAKTLGGENIAYLMGMRDAHRLTGYFENKRKDWVIPIHHTTGMSVRNRLRTGGFTDEVMGGNLDDMYEEILDEMLDDVRKKGSKELKGILGALRRLKAKLT